MNAARQPHGRFRFLYGIDGLAQRNGRCQIKRERHRWKLPLVVDCQRCRRLRHAGDRGQRDGLTTWRRDVELTYISYVLLKLWIDLENDAVLI